jgi:hypothetical protein
MESNIHFLYIFFILTRDGTVFQLSFTPIEYGKEKHGKLLIYTDEMLWSYLIKGTFPLYKIPKKKLAKVDHKWQEKGSIIRVRK